MLDLQNPFDSVAPMPSAMDKAVALNPQGAAAAKSRKRRRLPKVTPPIPCDPASADNRFELDEMAFMIEITPRPFFMQTRP